jgi:hypothetical protein
MNQIKETQNFTQQQIYNNIKRLKMKTNNQIFLE